MSCPPTGDPLGPIPPQDPPPPDPPPPDPILPQDPPLLGPIESEDSSTFLTSPSPDTQLHLRNRAVDQVSPDPPFSSYRGRKPLPAHETKASATHVVGDLVFVELSSFSFTPPVKNTFPLGHQIIERYLFLIRHRDYNFKVEDAACVIAKEIMAIWSKGNVPILTYKSVNGKLVKWILLFKKLYQYKNVSSKTSQNWYKTKYAELAKDMHEVFDIKAKDSWIAANEKLFRVPYGEKEQNLYHDQISKIFLVSVADIDKKWAKEDAAKQEKQLQADAKRRRLEQRTEKWQKEKSSSGQATESEINAATETDSPPEVESTSACVNDEMGGFEQYLLTRNRKRRLEECGEIKTAKDCDLKVRESYTMVYDK